MSIRLWAVGLALASLGFAGEAAACPRDRAIAGIVQRVSGQVGDTRIERAGAPTIRPAPMETLCEGDVVIASAAGASVTMRLDGAGASTLLQGPGRYTLPAARGRATVVDNALGLLMESWAPEIKRSSSFGVVRGRLGDKAEWAVPGLESGIATIRRGQRPLLLRWIGDTARYRVEVARENGALVEKADSTRPFVRLPAREWSGGYIVRVYEGGAKNPTLTGRFRAGDAPPANPTPFSGQMGEEVRAASEALRIIGLDIDRWSLEAVQMIDRAPSQGLDREALYRAIAGLDERTPTP
jgi:hypothetical protein